MSAENPLEFPQQVWQGFATPERQALIVKGVIRTAISLGLSPDQASILFGGLDKNEANNVAYELSGVADGSTVNQVGRALQQKVP
jgi:hypothetical protein